MEMILDSGFLYLDSFLGEQNLICFGLSQICGETTVHNPCIHSICSNHVMTCVIPYYIFTTLLPHPCPSTASVTHYQGLTMGPLTT